MRSQNWTRENILWLAGLLEGEGSFYVRRRKDRRPQVSVSLQMTDLDVVEKAKAIAGMGGTVTRGDRAKHYPGRGYKDIYQWRVQASEDAVALMWAVYPFMGARRQAAIRECVEAWRTNGGRAGRRVRYAA